MKRTFNGKGLKREMGLFSATILVIANMVGTGIFTTSGFIMAELGNPSALLLCWCAGGIFALCGALCYGELGARFPKAGGDYVFLKECFGKPVGFLSGWISLIVGFSAPIAAGAIAFSSYVFKAFSLSASPIIAVGNGFFTLTGLNLCAMCVIVLISFVHYHNLKTGSRIQNALTVFKITLILAFLAGGCLVGHGSLTHFQPSPGQPYSFSAEKFAVSLIFVSFAYSGWNAAAYLGSEIKQPRFTLPLSLFIGTVVVMALYLMLNVLYIYAVHPDAMKNVIEVGSLSAMSLFGDSFNTSFSLAVALGLLSVLSAMIMTGPRIYYAMSNDGVFFNMFGRLNLEHHTPASSIFLQAGIAILMVLTASFDTLLIYIGFTLSLFAMLTVIGLMRLKMKENTPKPGYSTLGYPLTPLIFILGNLWIIVFSIKNKPATALFGFGTIAAGLLVYLMFARKTSYHPEQTVQIEGEYSLADKNLSIAKSR